MLLQKTSVKSAALGKNSTHFMCQSCGDTHLKWSGKCASCNEWNTIIEFKESVIKADINKLALQQDCETVTFDINEFLNDKHEKIATRTTTGYPEFDRVLGGGIVPGSVILIGGSPGIGKSTLLLQIAHIIEGSLYCSGEESTAQIFNRTIRIGITKSNAEFLSTNSLATIIATINARISYLKVVIIDSIQTIYDERLDSIPGSVTQVRNATNELIKVAKINNVAMIIVGHITKEGQIAGPKLLEHMVDTVLYFDSDHSDGAGGSGGGSSFRILRSIKNRFGPTNEIGIFMMQDSGLKNVENPSEIFLNKNQHMGSSVIVASNCGTRIMLVEVQALVVKTNMTIPRRSTVGWDNNRLSMILAVISKYYGIFLGDKEIYLNIVGGIELDEPALDLAAVVALLAAAKNKIFDKKYVVFGEVGLGGETRKTSQAELRVKEAQRLGFEHIISHKLDENYKDCENILQIEHIVELKKIV